MRASFPVVVLLASLPPILVAQRPRPGVLIGAHVKLDQSPGPGTEGRLLAWRRDTLVVKSADRGDTVRIAANALNSIRVVESPALWGDTTTSDIQFYSYVGLSQSESGDSGPDSRYRQLVLVASADRLAALDPATGRAVWDRTDLGGLKEAAVDYVGNTGYGVITQGEQMALIDFRTGKTRWDTRALSFTAARGWLPLGALDSTMLLMGRTAQSPTTLVAVDVATGAVRWRQDHLFGVEPKVFTTSGIPYLFGNQYPIADSDSTVVLYISAEGPLRLDARTGTLLWRSSAFGTSKVPAPRDDYAWMRARRGMIYVPSEKQLVALRSADGRPAWAAPYTCKSKVIDMMWTPRGLLVRGEEWIDLLDPGAGRSLWPAPSEVKKSTRMIVRGDTIYIVADKKLLAIGVSEGTARVLAKLDYPDGEVPGGFAVFREGIVLNSWHHAQQLDRQGMLRNHATYPSPKETFGEALGRASIGTSTRRPGTFWGGSEIYFFTGAPDDGQHQGFSLVKFDPAAWREDGRIWFAKRVPDYLVDWWAGTVFYKPDDRILIGLTFGDGTALATAVHAGADQVTRLLDMGVDVDAVSASRWTALHYAAAHGHADLARLLLAHGAAVDASSVDGWTPWMVAAANGHADVMQVLKDAGAHVSDATGTLLRGWYLSDHGQVAAAESAFVTAQAMDSALAIWPEAWRQLCWSGVVNGQPTLVLSACDRAVQRAPRSGSEYQTARFDRGIARAVSGDFAGAADDIAASDTPTRDDDDARRLAAWIDALRAGTNPFTPAVVAALAQR